MKILVTGGAGYIGSSVVKSLVEQKYEVIVVDNLSNGQKKLVNKKATFYKIDILNKNALHKIFDKNPEIKVIIHMAALKNVEESMSKPESYNQNIIGTINILDIMVEFKIPKIIFSSTAAVYGTPIYSPIDENHSTVPVNYYGFTKLKCEEIIRWYSQIHKIKHVIFRYFNVAGDCGLNYIDNNAKNVFPILMEVISQKRKFFEIFGANYKTKDGTCVRDYIDINDLTDAHIKAIVINSSETINLGTNKGTSVLELVKTTEKTTGQKIPFEISKKRAGDPVELFTNYDKAEKILGWTPKSPLEEMIKSTYKSYVRVK